jgi:hypothetical protein
MRRKVIRFLLFFSGLIVLLLITALLLRPVILEKGISYLRQKVKSKYGAEILFGNAGVHRLSGLYFQNVVIIPPGGDTILIADSVYTALRVGSLSLGSVKLEEIKIFSGRIKLNKTDSTDNYSFLFRNEAETTDRDSSSSFSFSESADDILEKLFGQIPDYIELNNSSVTTRFTKYKLDILVSKAVLDDEKYLGTLNISENDTTQHLIVEGDLVPEEKTLTASVKSQKNELVTIPFIFQRFGARTGFRELNLEFKAEDIEEDEVRLRGFAWASDFILFHRRLSLDSIKLDSGSVDFNLAIGSRYIKIDSSSSVSVNQVKFNPYIFYQHKPDKHVTLSVAAREMDAQNFFNSLPSGVFDHMNGIKAEGKLSYNLFFDYDNKKPDSLVFDSQMERSGFKILDFGETELTKLNHRFYHKVYEKDRLVKSFIVGPENALFTPLSEISPYLVNSILTAEDGGFYFHKGFNEEAFRESIITNIREKKFKRGGSTISMQLVKNVFLTRNKTISRKLEEVLIVWLIENLRLAPKERMLEVYLNIIEWGPGIYGVKQASAFYFNKLPSDLTLAESIYLSSIVPRPKLFKYSFDKEGNLKPFHASYYRLLTTIMLRRNQLYPEDTVGLKPQVVLTGPARKYVVLSDTLLTEEEDEIID